MPQPVDQQPILWLWALSAWAGKVTAYLALRGIPHARCEQPVYLPRPDLSESLGVKYRRIPLMSIGRDIYCDTLLILEKLEQQYPSSGAKAEYPGIGARNGTELAVERLFEKWTDLCVFGAAANAIPTGLDLMKDPGFQKDREELWGRPWSQEEQDKLIPGGLANLRANFDTLESILADGSTWVLGNDDGPRLADIHAAWIFDWLAMLGTFPEEFFNAKVFPKTFAWLERYKEAVSAAKESTANKPNELESDEAIKRVLSSGFNTAEQLKVEPDPETHLKEGAPVEIYPRDTGFNHRDKGKLVGLNAHEVVISATAAKEPKEIRIHCPRWNFRVVPAA